MSNDPLLQPYQLKHLTLRNRIMTTSHEPAYGDDGMPKDRYRLYHLERARAGVAMVMTAGSASVSRDSPPVFSNLLVWKDEIVPWMKRLVDDCHAAGAAVMIQLSHLGLARVEKPGDEIDDPLPAGLDPLKELEMFFLPFALFEEFDQHFRVTHDDPKRVLDVVGQA